MKLKPKRKSKVNGLKKAPSRKKVAKLVVHGAWGKLHKMLTKVKDLITG